MNRISVNQGKYKIVYHTCYYFQKEKKRKNWAKKKFDKMLKISLKNVKENIFLIFKIKKK